MKYVEALDMYGIAFTFNTFGREKFKTNLGGILTIISVMILIVFFLLFGQELFFKLNPKIIQYTNIPDDYNMVHLSKENYTIPWRLEDINAQLFNSSTFLYPKISLMSYEFKNGSWSFKEHKFELTKCSEIEVDAYLKNAMNPEEWYCLNFNKNVSNLFDLMIGGFWDGNFINFIQFDFFSCDDNKNCTSYEELKLKMVSESKIYFSLFYPTSYFSPDKKGDPFKKYYTIWSKALDPNLIKSDRILLKEAKVKDDQGWIFSDIKSFKTLTFDRDFSNYDFKSVEDYKNEEVSSRIYTFYLYVIKKEELYYRSYTKIQDLAAQTGGVLKIVVFFFAIICEYHHHILRNKILVSEFFDSYEEIPFINENIRVASHQNRNESKLNINTNFNYNNSIVGLNVNSVSKTNKEMLQLNKTLRLNEPNESNKNKTELFFEITKQFFQYKNKINKDNLLAKEGSSFVWKNFVCKKYINKNKRKLSNGYNIALKYIDEKLDVKYYLQLIENQIKMRSIYFNKEHIEILNHLKKVNLLDEPNNIIDSLEFLDDPNEESENLVKLPKMLFYLMKNYQINPNLGKPYEDEKEMKLFEMLDNQYKDFIMENFHNFR